MSFPNNITDQSFLAARHLLLSGFSYFPVTRIKDSKVTIKLYRIDPKGYCIEHKTLIKGSDSLELCKLILSDTIGNTAEYDPFIPLTKQQIRVMILLLINVSKKLSIEIDSSQFDQYVINLAKEVGYTRPYDKEDLTTSFLRHLEKKVFIDKYAIHLASTLFA